MSALLYKAVEDAAIAADRADYRDQAKALRTLVAEHAVLKGQRDELLKALKALVYRDYRGVWCAGIEGGEDVTEIVGDVMAKVEGGA
jgi:hypothetical protein